MSPYAIAARATRTAAIPHADVAPAATSDGTSIARPTSAAASQNRSTFAVATSSGPDRLRTTEHVRPAAITANRPDTCAVSPATYEPNAATIVIAASTTGDFVKRKNAVAPRPMTTPTA